MPPDDMIDIVTRIVMMPVPTLDRSGKITELKVLVHVRTRVRMMGSVCMNRMAQIVPVAIGQE